MKSTMPYRMELWNSPYISSFQTCILWMPVDPVSENTSIQFVKGSHNLGTWFHPKKVTFFFLNYPFVHHPNYINLISLACQSCHGCSQSKVQETSTYSTLSNVNSTVHVVHSSVHHQFVKEASLWCHQNGGLLTFSVPTLPIIFCFCSLIVEFPGKCMCQLYTITLKINYKHNIRVSSAVNLVKSGTN